MPVLKHFTSLFVDDGAKEMLSAECAEAVFSGCELVDGKCVAYGW
jgi:hypothetical protein